MNLAALLQSQNLATLLAALAPEGELSAGRTVEARLLSVAEDGTATASVGGTKISLVLAGPEARQAIAQPGATLVLRLEAPAEPGGSLSATLVETRPPTGTPLPAQPVLTPRQPGQIAAAAALQPAPSPLSAASAVAAIASVHDATAPAVLLAPLVAASRGALNAAVPTAPAPGGPVRSPDAIQPGAPQSAPVRAQQPAQPPAQPAPALAPSPRIVAGPLLGDALAHQDGLAPLFANLRSLREGSVSLVLPRPLLALADQLLARALPVERRPLTAAALKEAVRGSGLFLESRSATAAPASAQPAAAQADLKAGLLALKGSLLPLVEALSPKASQPGKGIAAPGPDRPPLTAPDGSTRPSPPRRDGPLAPQPVVEPSLHAGDGPLTVASTLLEQTDAALDRLTLSQYASLPPEPARAEHGQRWHAEIPLAFPQGTAVLPLAVEKDPPHRDAPEGTAPLWRVRFALDVEPLGPMQGVVTLRNREVGVTLWAEREETSRLLRGAAPGLETALQQADFAQGRVDIHTGRPQTSQPTAGQFLDRMS